jgi:hypothetical protein
VAVNRKRMWTGLTVAMALAAGGVAAQGTGQVTRTKVTVTQMTAAQSAAVASEDAEYHDELMAAAASLKNDIKAESDASAAEVADAQSGPTGLGMMVAGGVIAFAILVSIIVIPASLRARRKRREMLADMLAGKPPRKR